MVVDHVSMAHRHAAFIVLSSIAEPLLMIVPLQRASPMPAALDLPTIAAEALQAARAPINVLILRNFADRPRSAEAVSATRCNQQCCLDSEQTPFLQAASRKTQSIFALERDGRGVSLGRLRPQALRVSALPWGGRKRKSGMRLLCAAAARSRHDQPLRLSPPIHWQE